MQIILICKDYLHKYFVEGSCFLWQYKIKGLMRRPFVAAHSSGDLHQSGKAHVDLAAVYILFIIQFIVKPPLGLLFEYWLVAYAS